MINSKLKILITTLLCLLPGSIFAATVRLDVPVTVGVDEDVIAHIVIDTEGESINAISGKILIDGDSISISQVRTGGSIVSLWIEEPKYENGSIFFSGVIPGGFNGASGPLFDVMMKGISEGALVAEFSNIIVLKNDGLGTRAEVNSPRSTINVSEGRYNPPLIVEKDEIPPEPFDVVVERDEDLFGGNYFVVFSAQDKGSGVDYYEVQEGKADSINESKWVVAESPHELSDQELASFVFVKAVDREGNTRISKLRPQKPPVVFKYLVYALIILLLVYIVLRLVKRRSKSVQGK